MDQKYLLIGNGPSREGLDLRKFGESYNRTIGCNSIWKDMSSIDYIVCWDNEPIIDMVNAINAKKLTQLFLDKLVKPDWFAKQNNVSNSGIYALKFFSQKLHEIELADTKSFDLLGVDCFLENGNGNCYSYGEDPIKHSVSDS